jgi:hypothetical protein
MQVLDCLADLSSGGADPLARNGGLRARASASLSINRP